MAAQPYKVINETTIFHKGSLYRMIDDYGVFYYKVPPYPKHIMPQLRTTAATILAENGFHGIVECKLVDFINTEREDHCFQDDGKSRVWIYNYTKYRLTGAGPGISWYSYIVDLGEDAQAGVPYLLVAQLLNDRERYTTISITVPEGEGWAKPYDEETFIPSIEECQEPNGFNPDVGVCIYTGREYECDGKPFNLPFLFYAKSRKVKITISHIPREEKEDEYNGAAVARIWVFRVLSPLPSLEVDYLEGYPRRRLGVYQTHPWYFYAHYGVPARTREQRIQSLQNMLDYMRFCGFNHLEFNIINGSDTTSCAWYDSKFYKPLIGNLIEELLPLTDKYNFSVIPVITSLFPPGICGKNDPLPDKPNELGFSKDSFQIDRDGKSIVITMGKRAPDPLRPETQNLLYELLREIGEKVKDHSSVKGLGFRVNGKIGLCYVGYIPQGQYLEPKCGQHSGYSKWDIAQFEKATGIDVPDNVNAYEWLKKNAWDKWLQFRCDETQKFWLKARDVIKGIKPDWLLFVKTDLPSEVPGTNIEWVKGTSIRDLLRHHGYDPELFTDEAGIIIQRVMMIAADRYFSTWGGIFGENYWAYKKYHFQPDVVKAYKTREGNAVEIYYNYWEEGGHPDKEFGDMRTATPAPIGRNYFEAASFSLRYGNVYTLTFMGWERPSLGYEAALRRWARAYLALPAIEGEDFTGKIEPADKDIWVRWFATRLAVLNDSPQEKLITLTIPKALKLTQYVVDLASGNELDVQRTPGEESFKVTLHLYGYDLHVLEIRERKLPSIPPPPPPGG